MNTLVIRSSCPSCPNPPLQWGKFSSQPTGILQSLRTHKSTLTPCVGTRCHRTLPSMLAFLWPNTCRPAACKTCLQKPSLLGNIISLPMANRRRTWLCRKSSQARKPECKGASCHLGKHEADRTISQVFGWRKDLIRRSSICAWFRWLCSQFSLL